MIIPNSEEGGYLAEVLELPGCISEGETPEEAYRNLEDAMTGWIAASLDTNRPIPDAVGDREYSGHFPLRMSTELHRVAALRAMQEGVSLNQWIAGAIAEKVTKEDLADMLADKIASKVAERMSFTALFGMQYGTRETSKETTTAKVELSDPGTTMMRADNVTSLAAGASGKVRILEWSKEAKQNA
jgi:antitoxin HicB